MFTLAHPWALITWLLPFVVWYLLPRAEFQFPAALKIPFYKAMADIADQDKKALSGQVSMLVPILIWFFAVLALAGPRWVGEPQPLSRKGYNIMMALDLSGSMQINDMLFHGRPVSRLSVVKHAAEEFVKERSGDKIGLILFGSRAYLQSPLTYDRHSVLMRIADATAGLAGKTTSIGDALGLAVKHLQDVPPIGRVIILLTDGANNSGVLQPLKAAELAKADGIKIYTIGLGAEADPRAMSSIFLMQNASADLDEESLKEVAEMTGAKYFRATDSQSLEQIYQTINQLETTKQDQAVVRPQINYYHWPLALAFILFLYWLADIAGFIRKPGFFSTRHKSNLTYDN